MDEFEKTLYSIVNQIRNYKKVKSVVIEVGELTPYSIEMLEMELKKYIRVDIKFLIKKAVVDCSCLFHGNPINISKRITGVSYFCPKCNKRNPPVIEGNKLLLKKIELL